jgi:ornithine cyclodeaminase
VDVRILKEAEVRRLVSPAQAQAAVREAFVKLARGQATLPGVIGLDIPEHEGEVHVKGAHLHGSPFYSIKEAAGFYGNARKGLPVGSGLVLVFDATTGLLRMILFDNGYLTELRTGAAGALAADLLARRDVETVGIIGSRRCWACAGPAACSSSAALHPPSPPTRARCPRGSASP